MNTLDAASVAPGVKSTVANVAVVEGAEGAVTDSAMKRDGEFASTGLEWKAIIGVLALLGLVSVTMLGFLSWRHRRYADSVIVESVTASSASSETPESTAEALPRITQSSSRISSAPVPAEQTIEQTTRSQRERLSQTEDRAAPLPSSTKQGFRQPGSDESATSSPLENGGEALSASAGESPSPPTALPEKVDLSAVLSPPSTAAPEANDLSQTASPEFSETTSSIDSNRSGSEPTANPQQQLEQIPPVSSMPESAEDQPPSSTSERFSPESSASVDVETGDVETNDAETETDAASSLLGQLPFVDQAIDPPIDQPTDQPIDPAIAPDARPEQIRVERFEIVGNTVFEDSELLAAVQQFLSERPTSDPQGTAITEPQSSDGSGVSSSPNPLLSNPPSSLSTQIPFPINLTRTELARIGDVVSQFYIERNYINSGAYISENELEDETVSIQVVEGRLGTVNVDVSGANRFRLRPSYVRDRLQAATRGPLNLDELVESVQLLERDPLIRQISTEVAPGLEAGSSTLNVNVVQDSGFDTSFSTSNYSSPSVGQFGQRVGLSQANLLGLGDRISASYERTEGSSRWNFGYSIPLNARNGTLGLSFRNVDSRVVESPFDRLDITSESQTYKLSFRQPLVQTLTEEFALNLSAYRRNSEGLYLEALLGEALPLPGRGNDLDGRSRITALRLGQSWVKRYPKQVFALDSELSLGLNVLNSTTVSDGPDSRFLRWTARSFWTRRLGSDALFSVQGRVQFADRPLVPSEQFGTGGQSSVRGYRPNALLTDSGWFLSSELRVPVLKVARWDSDLQVAPFLDLGGGWDRDDFATDERSVLASTGLGLIWQTGDDFSARVDWAIPLTATEILQDTGLQFQIRYTPF
ncbi:ShlB/FhaC/HecB family hemolysin secretion/activation protein [cf. Phormidesmis sp. LEGE 11477]|uniref:ShlB/FhaC/HecB family hemolysin secretion/activation protein n=1 Tax=cf. Phormidesmis sp. LEGE 11477 TaxID=1828680 RepID=UPI001880DF8E|nr:ShlB/FhaC/HecB family hemolysin secretion/activation protein [cf. Phormidesmis sp. LEGE 11477]MBE9062988.1 BamA/TamA family outer membrane protein [cf. Phormidesmis sp. LEGE 11477]